MDGAQAIAERSRGTPRVANRLLKRVRDYAQVHGDGTIDAATAYPRWTCWGSTTRAWTGWTARSSSAICERFGGGPVGLSTLAVAVHEEQDTIEDVYEPYLLQRGFLQRTPRGRVATPHAFRHLGLEPPASGQACSEPNGPYRSFSPRATLPNCMAHLFICPNCGNRTTATERTSGFRNVPKGCSKCGFGFLFELLDDYYPAPNAAFFVCDKEGADHRLRPRFARAHRPLGREGDRPSGARRAGSRLRRRRGPGRHGTRMGSAPARKACHSERRGRSARKSGRRSVSGLR